jgi:hypothetical protein
MYILCLIGSDAVVFQDKIYIGKEHIQNIDFDTFNAILAIFPQQVF